MSQEQRPPTNFWDVMKDNDGAIWAIAGAITITSLIWAIAWYNVSREKNNPAQRLEITVSQPRDVK